MKTVSPRYHRFVHVQGIGDKAPQQLRESKVVVIGCGALGSATASLLVRCGIGTVRLVDRDVVDESNLADQCVYSEHDARRRTPKAEAAAEYLQAIDSAVEIEARVADFSHFNAESLVDGIDLIIDGSDNLETKYLINDVAVARDMPWVYGGCAGSEAVVLAVIPRKTSCLRCVWNEPPPPARVDGCESMGMLPATASLAASFQATEAIKILLGKATELLPGLIRADVWDGWVRHVPMRIIPLENNSCPACGLNEFPYLNGKATTQPEILCGREAILLTPGLTGFDLGIVKARLQREIPITERRDCVQFNAEGCQIFVFSNGRAVIHGTSDPGRARTLYSRYLSA